jgi:hypothetical protein
MEVLLEDHLKLGRCPHCGIAHPNLDRKHDLHTVGQVTPTKNHWFIYECKSCGKIVTAYAAQAGQYVIAYFPAAKTVNEDIPDRPRTFLKEAMESSHTPTGAVMLGDRKGSWPTLL